MKKIITTAIALAFASSLSHAAVTVTGSIRTALDSVDISGATDKKIADSDKVRIADQSSRITFKGEDKLDNGATLIWWLESGVNVGEGASAATFGTRNTFIGYKIDDVGTFRFGKFDNAYKLWTGDVGLGDSTFNDDSGFFGGKRILRRAGDRLDQIVSYESPKWAGFKVRADYDFDSGKTDKTDAYSTSVAVSYDQEYFNIGAAYDYANDRAIKPGSVSLKKGDADRAAGTSIDSVSAIASGKFAGIVLSGLYERVNWDDGKKTSHQDSYGANISYKWDKLTLQGAYVIADDVSNLKDSGADQYVIGARYSLTKQSSLNLTYAQINNDKNAKFATEASNVVIDKGQDARLITLGVRTDF